MPTIALGDITLAGVELMIHAIRCPGDDYGLRGSNLEKVAKDIIRGPVDLAFPKRGRQHLATLDYVLQNSTSEREIAVVSRARDCLTAVVKSAEACASKASASA